MRGTIDGLLPAFRLAATLPTMLREDPFAVQLCSGLDEVLAPVVLDLDCWPAYLDPRTVPDDMVAWLGHWLGLQPGPDTDPDRLRARLPGATALHAACGTPRGIALAVEQALGLQCEVVDSGGTRALTSTGGPLPGEDRPSVTVTVSAARREDIDVEALEDVVAAAVPAHVERRIEVVLTG